VPSLRRYSPTKLCDGAQTAIFASFLGPVFSASRVQHVSDLHSKFALRPHHVRSVVDIQSATAEIRRGKKEEARRKREQDENIMSASATQGVHNNFYFIS